MPVMSKTKLEMIKMHLDQRYRTLRDAIEWRDLNSAKEGAGKGSWMHPEKMCATVASDIELRMAVEDFKTILDEIKKLK